jgi:hypothetical protein
LIAVKEELEANNKEIVVLRELGNKKNQRYIFAYALAGCAAVAMYFGSWM